MLAEHEEARAANVALVRRFIDIGRFRIRGGKITAFAEYLDPTRFVTALGGTVVPPPTIPAGR